MNARILPLAVFALAFLVAVASVASIPQSVWSVMPAYKEAIIAFNLMVGLAAVLVAYWVHADYEMLQRANGQSDSHGRTVERLGEIVDENFDIVFKRLDQMEGARRKEERAARALKRPKSLFHTCRYFRNRQVQNGTKHTEEKAMNTPMLWYRRMTVDTRWQATQCPTCFKP